MLSPHGARARAGLGAHVSGDILVGTQQKQYLYTVYIYISPTNQERKNARCLFISTTWRRLSFNSNQLTARFVSVPRDAIRCDAMRCDAFSARQVAGSSGDEADAGFDARGPGATGGGVRLPRKAEGERWRRRWRWRLSQEQGGGCTTLWSLGVPTYFLAYGDIAIWRYGYTK